MADLRDVLPTANIFSISCSFVLENLAKSYDGARPRGLAPSPTGNPGSAPAIIECFEHLICHFLRLNLNFEVTRAKLALMLIKAILYICEKLESTSYVLIFRTI